jgi:hypothetical protein
LEWHDAVGVAIGLKASAARILHFSGKLLHAAGPPLIRAVFETMAATTGNANNASTEFVSVAFM